LTENPRNIVVNQNPANEESPVMFTQHSSAVPPSNLKPLFFTLIVALALLAFAAPTLATEKTDAMAIVNKFVDSFNKGDVKAVAAACTEEASILDEFPPYEWHGTGACAKWTAAYDADAKKNGITDGIVTLGAPRHVSVSADRAYVVVPANYKFKQNGKPVQEIGSTLTVALQNTSAGWRITAWSWAKH
jgi:ketosteroid isomerase-like protein